MQEICMKLKEEVNMSAEQTQNFSQPFETVFEACKNAVIDSKFKLKEADIGRGYIKCKGKSDFRTMYGEKIKIYVTKAPNGTQVRIKAKAEGPSFTSFGKTDETINKFLSALQMRLQSPTGGTQPSGAPPPQYPCKKCGQPLSYVDQHQKWYCNKCKKYV